MHPAEPIIEGNPMGPGSCNPIEEHAFLVEELAMWIHGILDTGWGRGVRRVQAEGERGLVDFITAQLTGIGGNESMVMQAISGFKSEYPELGVPWEWDVEVRSTLAHHLRRAVFPLCVAANKADVAEPGPGMHWRKRSKPKAAFSYPPVPTVNWL